LRFGTSRWRGFGWYISKLLHQLAQARQVLLAEAPFMRRLRERRLGSCQLLAQAQEHRCHCCQVSFSVRFADIITSCFCCSTGSSSGSSIC
jgi:hypothetical protein